MRQQGRLISEASPRERDIRTGLRVEFRVERSSRILRDRTHFQGVQAES